MKKLVFQRILGGGWRMAEDGSEITLSMSMSGVPALIISINLIDFLVERKILSVDDKKSFYQKIFPLFDVEHPDMSAVAK